jgi:hypothetical protein
MKVAALFRRRVRELIREKFGRDSGTEAVRRDIVVPRRPIREFTRGPSVRA